MSTLYTMVGLPGSGKSTFAVAHPECVVVSTDAIRAEMFGSEERQEGGAEVFAEAHRRISAALASGHDVIFDATNVNRRARRRALAHKAHHVAVFVSTSADECKKRNTKRARKVPEFVIDSMAQRLVVPSTEEGFDEVITL